MAKDYYGPSVSDGSGINANFIPGPVLGAGQMELSSVKLSSDTPSIGDTLTATPYISSYQQAPADAKVTYTWSASTSQYSGFTKIEGETGASLVVGDDLEGKYIRVEANAGVNTVSKTISSKVKQAGAVEISAVSIVNTKDNTSVFAVGDTAKARAKEKGGAYGAFVDADKLNFQWQSSDTKSGGYTDIVAPRVRRSSLPTLWAASTSSARCPRRSALRATPTRRALSLLPPVQLMSRT